MKMRIMKNDKNSCCKNNLCKDIVRANIMLLSRFVMLSTHYGSPYLRKIPFTSPTPPSLLWLELLVRYYAGTNRGHNFLAREEFTVCMWETPPKEETIHDSWCSHTNLHYGNTDTNGK
jgi:hypothetical protein